jgi:hypothetical protein
MVGTAREAPLPTLRNCKQRIPCSHDFAIPRREAPELCARILPLEKQRAQGKPGARCTRSLACKIKSTRVRNHRFTGTPGLPCAMVLTAYTALSPVTGLCCHRRLRGVSGPSGPTCLCKLDTSVGVSGPHGFAVRFSVVRLATLPRPPHPAPNVRDDRDTPLFRGGTGES